jgi:hypothetical protein
MTIASRILPGLFEDGQLRVGILPQSEEVLIGAPGFGSVTPDNVCTARLQVRQGADRIGQDDAAVIEDFLKFHRCFLAACRCKPAVRLKPACLAETQQPTQQSASHLLPKC